MSPILGLSCGLVAGGVLGWFGGGALYEQRRMLGVSYIVSGFALMMFSLYAFVFRGHP